MINYFLRRHFLLSSKATRVFFVGKTVPFIIERIFCGEAEQISLTPSARSFAITALSCFSFDSLTINILRNDSLNTFLLEEGFNSIASRSNSPMASANAEDLICIKQSSQSNTNTKSRKIEGGQEECQ